MRGTGFFLAFSIIALLVADFSVAQNRQRNQKTQTNPQKEIKVEFPEGTDTPVLTMDMVGGFRAKLPAGFEPTPMLRIYSDGRVLTGRRTDALKEVEGTIDLVELKSLLVFIVDDCHFFELSSESIKAEMESKRSVRIMDAGTTKVEINLKGNSNAVEVYALPLAAGEFSDVPSVVSMVAISSRCRQLIAKTKLGADEEADLALNAVNKSLAEKFKKTPKFTMKHLQFAEQYVDERRSATFVNNFVDGKQKMMAYATFQADAKGEVEIVVDVLKR